MRKSPVSSASYVTRRVARRPDRRVTRGVTGCSSPASRPPASAARRRRTSAGRCPDAEQERRKRARGMADTGRSDPGQRESDPSRSSRRTCRGGPSASGCLRRVRCGTGRDNPNTRPRQFQREEREDDDQHRRNAAIQRWSQFPPQRVMSRTASASIWPSVPSAATRRALRERAGTATAVKGRTNCSYGRTGAAAFLAHAS